MIKLIIIFFILQSILYVQVRYGLEGNLGTDEEGLRKRITHSGHFRIAAREVSGLEPEEVLAGDIEAAAAHANRLDDRAGDRVAE